MFIASQIAPLSSQMLSVSGFQSSWPTPQLQTATNAIELDLVRLGINTAATSAAFTQTAASWRGYRGSTGRELPSTFFTLLYCPQAAQGGILRNWSVSQSVMALYVSEKLS